MRSYLRFYCIHIDSCSSILVSHKILQQMRWWDILRGNYLMATTMAAARRAKGYDDDGDNDGGG